jgi:hypothetical protein
MWSIGISEWLVTTTSVDSVFLFGISSDVAGVLLGTSSKGEKVKIRASVVKIARAMKAEYTKRIMFSMGGMQGELNIISLYFNALTDAVDFLKVILLCRTKGQYVPRWDVWCGIMPVLVWCWREK